ncbi:DUF1028 domain-containing protein [Aliivibrio sp. S4TY2]|uniref:DUF1028 domain-containing protein n=1 Tax=unclassified Aliivibrio TaxID=2645654 RepID=UPI0023793CA9|nr:MULTISPECIES: DUF1028 domain-containing protein [unclassified Aliivibrio]MDD9158507.1 DUF1028 domain-containing protein [Aliivibrio sp. S4TY2]MDD9162508.1 DUF1028 domain-containing protein [Aliivibrio sp. S4TY1]MDD9166506.1 DUF1028 domain-containing protein [Aliivibrio sp. S4MY2]MDD9170504.1 DUF1028 domain-containing protein [Aliivibrio sp. S4MY4]MDD9186867.1 DUF1028 domain-containing protein [Aliivibrio sp. S4MY3]
MKKMYLFISTIALSFFTSNANATFSLVAYDEISGYYGVAFASCVFLPPEIDITERVNAITPIGTITTQATVNYDNINLEHGRQQILGNVRGNQILEWLYNNDQDGDFENKSRQYLVLSNPSLGPVEGFAYTGSEVPSDKGSIIKKNVVVAGNTLFPDTLQVMYEGYEQEQDFFVDKLLKSLTNVRDNSLGDIRCDGVSSYTAFIKVNDKHWFYNSSNLDEDAINGLERIINDRQKPKVCLSLIAGTAFLANIDIKGNGEYSGPYGVGSTICSEGKSGEIFYPQFNVVAGVHKSCGSVEIKEDSGIINYDAWGTTLSPRCVRRE